MKISTGMGFLLSPTEELLSALSELVRELKLSRLSMRRSSNSRRKSGPASYLCFSFFVGCVLWDRVGTAGADRGLDFFARKANFDIHEAGEDCWFFMEDKEDVDHLDMSWGLFGIEETDTDDI